MPTRKTTVAKPSSAAKKSTAKKSTAKKSTAKKAVAKRSGAPTRSKATLATSIESLGFQEGDVVVDAEDPQRVGRVCRIVNPGSSYQVRFAMSNQCMLTPHSAILPAPTGASGPPCTPDC